MTKTRRNNEQKQANRNNFANHNYDSFANTIISNPIAKPQYTTQEHDYTHQIQKPVSQSLLIGEKRKSLPHRTENHPIFPKNENTTIKQFTRSQPHYSEDEDYFNQK